MIDQEWNDPKVKWNIADYGNMKVLHVGEHETWKPDISLYRSGGMELFGDTNSLAYNNGTVLWVKMASLKTHCMMDMRYWPYDKHICTLYLGSWTYNANEVDFVGNEISKHSYESNNEWWVSEVDVKRTENIYPCCPEPYVAVEFHIHFERRSPLYKSVVLAPALMVIVMTLANFWLPAQSGEKIMLNGVNIIIVVSFLVFFAQKIPITSSNTPLVG